MTFRLGGWPNISDDEPMGGGEEYHPHHAGEALGPIQRSAGDPQVQELNPPAWIPIGLRPGRAAHWRRTPAHMAAHARRPVTVLKALSSGRTICCTALCRTAPQLRRSPSAHGVLDGRIDPWSTLAGCPRRPEGGIPGFRYGVTAIAVATVAGIAALAAQRSSAGHHGRPEPSVLSITSASRERS